MEESEELTLRDIFTKEVTSALSTIKDDRPKSVWNFELKAGKNNTCSFITNIAIPNGDKGNSMNLHTLTREFNLPCKNLFTQEDGALDAIKDTVETVFKDQGILKDGEKMNWSILDKVL